MADRIKKLLDNKIINNVLTPVFVILLILFALCKVNLGVDISDTTYNFGNFRYSFMLDNMWYCSTYLANVTGHLFSLFPFGNTYIGLNLYTGIIKAIVAIVAFFFLTKTVKLPKSIVFFGELTALGLCWCPTALIYNYLSYLLFLLGTVFLYKGLVENSNKMLIIAGVFLGTNIFVRFPNIVEASMIIALWYYCIIKKETFKSAVSKTLYCLAGYVGAAVVLFVIIGITRGFGAYITAIQELFSMTDEASQYSGTGIIRGLYFAYKDTLRWLWIVAVAGIVSFLTEIFISDKLKTLKTVIAILLGTVVTFILYKRYLFDFNYSEYSSIYHIGALMMTIMVLVLCLVAFINKFDSNIRLLAVMAVGIIGITPLGTNNEIYSNLNNLFIVFPVFLYIIASLLSVSRNLQSLRIYMVVLIAVFVYQSMMFGMTFVFRDGYDASMDTQIEGLNTLTYMRTTRENALLIKDICNIIDDNDLYNRELLLYGDVPGLAFCLNMQPAISSTWPSLASYSASKFDSELNRLDEALVGKAMEYPLVIISGEIYNSLKSGGISAKEQRLIKFLTRHRYETIYMSDTVCILVSK